MCSVPPVALPDVLVQHLQCLLSKTLLTMVVATILVVALTLSTMEGWDGVLKSLANYTVKSFSECVSVISNFWKLLLDSILFSTPLNKYI